MSRESPLWFAVVTRGRGRKDREYIIGAFPSIEQALDLVKQTIENNVLMRAPMEYVTVQPFEQELPVIPYQRPSETP